LKKRPSLHLKFDVNFLWSRSYIWLIQTLTFDWYKPKWIFCELYCILPSNMFHQIPSIIAEMKYGTSIYAFILCTLCK
jgi:hypothetical protein